MSSASQTRPEHGTVEQDHRFIKRLVKPGLRFFLSETAWRTLQGYKAMNMLRKGQIYGIDKRDSMKQVAFIASRQTLTNMVDLPV